MYAERLHLHCDQNLLCNATRAWFISCCEKEPTTQRPSWHNADAATQTSDAGDLIQTETVKTSAGISINEKVQPLPINESHFFHFDEAV
jgi:hypothetical protein